MTALLFVGLMFAAIALSVVIVPLILLKVAFVVVLSLIAIPFRIMGGLARGVFKGMFWLALLAIPLAILALPLTIVAGGSWLVYRAFRPKRASQAYVVA